MTSTTDSAETMPKSKAPDFAETAPARVATRLAFIAAGFVMACCAPLIPFLKANVGADKAEFGILLLCLGLGSIIAMPATGVLAARRGARPLILWGGFGLIVMLPVLALAEQQGGKLKFSFRRRERAMLRFRRMRSLRKFATVHSSVHDHFNQDRHLASRENFKLNRIAVLAEWRQLCSA